MVSPYLIFFYRPMSSRPHACMTLYKLQPESAKNSTLDPVLNKHGFTDPKSGM